MKNKLVFKYVGKVLISFSILLLIPILVSLVYKESFIGFLIPLFFSLGIGLLLNKLNPKNKTLYARDGFMIVSIAWIIICLLSAIPLYMGADVSFIDALFESVSGLTTTGATIFDDVEKLGKSILDRKSVV